VIEFRVSRCPHMDLGLCTVARQQQQEQKNQQHNSDTTFCFNAGSAQLSNPLVTQGGDLIIQMNVAAGGGETAAD